MTRILLIDDDTELVSLLREYLIQDGFSVTTASDGALGAAEALSGGYAIVVLDVMMPQLNGLDALRRIRRESTLPVIMLTARGDDIDRIVGLELGADDYVTKPCTPRELAARLRAILRRTQAVSSSGPLGAGELRMYPERRQVEWRGKSLALTSAEFNVLEVLLRNAGRVVTKKEIYEQALGRQLGRFDRSADVHVSSIRQKLGDASALIKTVRGIGYHLIKD